MAKKKYIPKNELNLAEVRVQAQAHKLSQKMITHFIRRGQLSPSLSKETDLDRIAFLASMIRDRGFVRLLLAKYTQKERSEFCDNAGLNSGQVKIYTMLKDAKAQRRRLSTACICVGVYEDRGLKYDHRNPDKPLIAEINRLRKKVQNATYRDSRKDCPIDEELMALEEQLMLEQERMAEIMKFAR